MRRLIYEDVKHFIEVESGSECKLLSEKYVNNTTKMLFECVCGNKFETTYATFKFKSQRQCSECRSKDAPTKRIKTNNVFVEEVHNLVGSEYTFLEKYKGALTKIDCKHNDCGYIWSIRPNNFLNGRRCPQCAGVAKPTYQEVKNFVEGEHGNKCKLLSEDYINSITKMLFKCRCGNEFETSFSEFKHMNKKQCNHCGFKNPHNLKTTDEFIKQVYELYGDEYIVLGEYITNKSKILCKHTVCNHIWSVKPNNFLNGTRCPNCYASNPKPNEQFLQECYELVGDEYEILEDYKSKRTKIKCKHNKCGYEWDVLPYNFLRGTRCPQCAESKGERAIRECLQNNNIKFQQEYSFDDLVGTSGGILRFDFVIFSNNSHLQFLIEYDGDFHYQDICEDGRFELQQIHDKLKNQYCKDNDIPLIRIPYWQFDKIEQILDKWLNKYGLTLK